MENIPNGTVTFLFTDIEGSTKLAQQYPDSIAALLERHHAILKRAIESHGGTVFQIIGDAFCASFHTVDDAMQAALDAQYALVRERWVPEPIQVRMGIHSGAARAVTEAPDSTGYSGYLTLTRTQRIMSAAHGGQILLSNASAELARAARRGDVGLRDLGYHRLKSLPDPEPIWQVVAPGLRQDFPPLASLNATPNNLPLPLTSFVGREREVREVCQLLDTHRLITLTGSGGTGKSRLSLQVAAEVMDRFKHGVWFIGLAPLSDPALVPNLVASALGLRGEQSRSLAEALLDWMGRRELLLVLDNCEHLIESCAQFAEALLHTSRGSRILASSIEALGIPGEQTYRVPSLECPKPGQASQIPLQDLMQYPAIRLFAERAKESLATFQVNSANATAVVKICQRLDGIPLALELAAARVKVLHVEQIAERLDDRFRLLTGGGRTRLPRHQTLRSLIDWSYGLLTAPEQVLLRRLSVFAGGWTLHAAEGVCKAEGVQLSEVLELLGHLVDKSLVVADEAGKESRYRMLETIRQYAHERLQESGEDEVIRNQHLEYFMEAAENAERIIFGPKQLIWFDRLELEWDNIRAALEWSRASQQIMPGLRLAGALAIFWSLRVYWSEGYEALVSLLKETKGERSVVRAKALMAAGELASYCGYADQMLQYFEEGYQILQESGEAGKRLLGSSLWQYAFAFIDRDPMRGQTVAEEGIRVSRETGDVAGLAKSLFILGMIARRRADFAVARSAQEESFRLFRDLGDQQMMAILMGNLGTIDDWEGKLVEAKERYDESARIAREIGNTYIGAIFLSSLGDIARRQGNYEEAGMILHRSLAYHREIGSAHQHLVQDLLGLGLLELSVGNLAEAKSYLNEGVTAAVKGKLLFWLRFLFDALGYLASAGNPARAARLFGAADRLREQLGTPLYPSEHDEYEKYTQTAKSQLDEESWNAAWNEGRGMTLEKSIEYALQSG